MAEAFDAFQEENEVLRVADSVLAEAAESVSRNVFESQVKAYRKLLKSLQKLTRLSDRSEERIKLAHAQIQEQQAELEKAHEALSHHAELLELKVQERTRELRWERSKLEQLVQVGIGLSSERNEDHLLDLILTGAMEISGADWGMLYARTETDQLAIKIIRVNSLDMFLGGQSGRPIAFPALPMFLSDGQQNLGHIVPRVAHERLVINVTDVATESDPQFNTIRRFDKAVGYQSKSLLMVPLLPRGGEVVGVLQLMNARDPGSEQIVPFARESQSFVEALASQAAIAISNQHLIAAQRRLMDAFVEVISVAVDAKSPYTGGHNQRVGELARMLGEAVSAQTEGPFADFGFANEDEWREFRFSALLHDCGKVTTPEAVVDKATKLETVYNRIHEVRTRFEVLWRDAEIDYWRQRSEGVTPVETLDAELTARRATLQEEFAFIAECNVGGEFMSPQRIARLQEIAQRRWLRHFDDWLGISQEEALLRPGKEKPSLPVEELLLADRPEHVVPRGNANPFGDNPMQFKITVPEALYNRGEVYNLSISRGTLTPEDRFKISDHVIQTYQMLNCLPFPKELQRVPEFAGSHHETLNGKGYPRQLSGEQISIPARILAVADVFEALTACDRPYKKAKTLSEAMKIMSFMVKDGHIDSDLFELLKSSGVGQEYAKRYLLPEQLDQVA
ncbi:MAG: GAF domain-containing protein [Magnetococcales bacterium]|nr:GAF domain-containing protein [Magnetococcales bacterium]NGZ07204.1 GAF domain-containing protein [Magnetococcales bacterium]